MARSWRARLAKLERVHATTPTNPLRQAIEASARAQGLTAAAGSPEYLTQWLAGVAARQAAVIAHPPRHFRKE